MNSKGKRFFCWAFIYLVIMVNKSTTELNNYQLTQVVTKLEKQLKICYFVVLYKNPIVLDNNFSNTFSLSHLESKTLSSPTNRIDNIFLSLVNNNWLFLT